MIKYIKIKINLFTNLNTLLRKGKVITTWTRGTEI